MTPCPRAARDAAIGIALLVAVQPPALATAAETATLTTTAKTAAPAASDNDASSNSAPDAPSAVDQAREESDPALVSPSNPNTGPLPPGAVDKRGSAAAPQVAGEDAIVEQPRSFGYTLGDVLTQRVALTPEFQPAQLPPIERAGLWFSRRSVILKKADDGRQRLVMEYQLVNAPQTLMTVNLPVVTLKSKAGSALTVAAWPISVGPLTPQHAFAKGDLLELRPDRPAPKVPTLALQRQLEIWVTAFAVTVAAWLAWWAIRSIRAAANQPFAKALREVRQANDNSPDAWLALHRAFDRTAGRALQTSTLPALFKQAPHFAPERIAIEQFYNASNLRFFGGTSARAPTATSARAPTATSARAPTVTSAQAPTATSAHATTAVPITAAASAPSHLQGRVGDRALHLVELRALAATLRRIEKQHEQ